MRLLVLLLNPWADLIAFGTSGSDLLRRLVMPALAALMLAVAQVPPGRWLELLSPRRMLVWSAARSALLVLSVAVTCLPAAGSSGSASLVSIRNLLINMTLIGLCILVGRTDLAWLPVVVLLAMSLFAGGDPDNGSWSPLFHPPDGMQIVGLFVVAIALFASAPFLATHGWAPWPAGTTRIDRDS
jgi:hypothetical protein